MEGEIALNNDTIFLSLKGFKIYMYRRKTDTDYFDSVFLKGFRVSNSSSSPLEFDIANPLSGVGYHFKTKSADERQKWTDAIVKVLEIISKIPDRPAAQGAAVASSQPVTAQQHTSLPRDNAAPPTSASSGASAASSQIPLEAIGSGKFQASLNTIVLRDYDHMFSFECPEHWEPTWEMLDDTQERHDACIVTEERQVPAFLFVDALVPDPSDPEDIYPSDWEAFQRLCAAVVDEEGGTVTKSAPKEETVGGVKFQRIEYTVANLPEEDSSKKLQFSFWCGFREGRAYRIGFKGDSVAFSAHLAEAEQIVSSFAFINDSQAWSKPQPEIMDGVSKYKLSGSVRYINRTQGFTLMAPTTFANSAWRISFVAPLLVSFHVIVPDAEDSEDRLVIANVQVLREDIGDADDSGAAPLSDPDDYARTSRDGILALGNEKIRAEGHDIERCTVGPYDARKFLTVLEYSNDEGEITRAQYLITYTLMHNGSAWIIQFSSTEKDAMDDYLPVVTNFVLPSFHLL